jgi:hypothetical protein
VISSSAEIEGKQNDNAKRALAKHRDLDEEIRMVVVMIGTRTSKREI